LSGTTKRWGSEYTTGEIPEELVEKAKEYREKMIEAIAESDDGVLFEKFVHGEAISEAEISAGIRKATIALKIFPVICGTAFKNKGVQTMLDAVVDYLPSPLDVPAVEGVDVRRSGEGAGSPRIRFRAFCRSGFQDHD